MFGGYCILIANNRDPDGLASRMTAADRGRVRRVKIGDEISTRTGAAAVNGDDGPHRGAVAAGASSSNSEDAWAAKLHRGLRRGLGGVVRRGAFGL